MAAAPTMPDTPSTSPPVVDLTSVPNASDDAASVSDALALHIVLAELGEPMQHLTALVKVLAVAVADGRLKQTAIDAWWPTVGLAVQEATWKVRGDIEAWLSDHYLFQTFGNDQGRAWPYDAWAKARSPSPTPRAGSPRQTPGTSSKRARSPSTGRSRASKRAQHSDLSGPNALMLTDPNQQTLAQAFNRHSLAHSSEITPTMPFTGRPPRVHGMVPPPETPTRSPTPTRHEMEDTLTPHQDI
jgi:hypothetical protein